MEMTVTALLGSRAGLDDGKLLILQDRVACKIQQMERWKLLGDNLSTLSCTYCHLYVFFGKISIQFLCPLIVNNLVICFFCCWVE